jgi:hypothetical protein
MISETELDAIRADQNTLLPETATILDEVAVSDGRGGTRSTWVAREDPLPARLGVPADRRAGGFAGQLTDAATYVVTFPAGTVIDERARIVIGGATYTVTGKLGPKSYETAHRVLVAEVQ